jgi:hypothetical protein
MNGQDDQPEGDGNKRRQPTGLGQALKGVTAICIVRWRRLSHAMVLGSFQYLHQAWNERSDVPVEPERLAQRCAAFMPLQRGDWRGM